jgi:retron-type reverse transcriptase
MKDTWESLFIKEAIAQGHSDEFVRECIKYATKLHANNMPVIFDFKHLASIFDVEAKYLFFLCKDVDQHYRTYAIKKKANPTEYRLLTAPDWNLKRIQLWILRNILIRDSSVSSHAHGFVKNRSIVTNAKAHEGAQWMLCVDLKDFFDNIRKCNVFQYFDSLGYEKSVTTALTSFCTYENHLPQGAPTSPCLSNLIAIEMDTDIQYYCEKNGFVYTRYADDITISSKTKIAPNIREVNKIIHKHGFRLNSKKTKLIHQGQKMKVTGLTVGKGVHVPKSFKKAVSRELHFCEKYTPFVHSSTMYPDKMFYKEWLLGKIQYIRSIDEVAGNKMLERFNKLNWIL